MKLEEIEKRFDELDELHLKVAEKTRELMLILQRAEPTTEECLKLLKRIDSSSETVDRIRGILEGGR